MNLYDNYKYNEYVTQFYTYSMCKEHPAEITIGDYKVYPMSYGGNSINILKSLGIFFALDEVWEEYIPSTPPKSEIARKYWKKISNNTADCIVLAVISDGGVDEHIYKIIKEAITDNPTLKVGFGCVGGHGRTGWVLTKLCIELGGMNPNKALEYIRKVYCEQAVESIIQKENLGIKVILYPTKGRFNLAEWLKAHNL